MSSISFENNDDYLKFTYSGEYDFDELMSYLKFIKDKCEEGSMYKALLDLSVMEGAMADDMERFYLGEELYNLFGSKIKFAYITKELHSTRVGEMVAVNRGANAHIFHDIETARKWLLNID